MNLNILNKIYNHQQIEPHWYIYWEKQNAFTADPTSNKPSYSIVIPPPNITGQLHIGHALDSTLQDILCRFKRMQGYQVLWLPGTDHAGIATQNVIENEIAKEGLSRHELGRKKFIERIWQWKTEYGNKIINQLKRLGASCDWNRKRFTMDEGLSLAVREVFIRLYEDGLIYRDNYIINWCPRCQTALSDIETINEEIEEELYYIRYFFRDNKNWITVATTRPETIPGDTALGINPDATNYHKLIDNTVIIPLINREIPIIKDNYISTNFGSGVLKITPAHDHNDFELAKKHNLKIICIMDNNGNLNKIAGSYAGLNRLQARKKILFDLENQKFLENRQKYIHSVAHCYRCKTVIEPILSKQWFVRTAPLAIKALQAVKQGKIRIIPNQWNKIYEEWITNIRDWCISRQIWWGHPIPAWYCSCGEIIVKRSIPDKCCKCGSMNLKQETDVLDTWFSSALWPFSTMGWPNQTAELAKFYPTSCLITGFDILFFWVARMIMMGIKFTKKIPFREVYIHALVRDEHGQKMSKSKGNVIDPIIFIDKYGADAFRFSLASSISQNADIKINKERIINSRKFVTKLWNAARFTLTNIENKTQNNYHNIPLLTEDSWIINRVYHAANKVALAINEYRFNEAANISYNFVWHEFCDWYLELVKIPLSDNNNPTRQNVSKHVLFKVFTRLLRILHPFMPFITEEIWQHLPGTNSSIMKAPWPVSKQIYMYEEAEKKMNLIINIINAIRNIRAEIGIKPNKYIKLYLEPQNNYTSNTIFSHSVYIKKLTKTDEFLTIIQDKILINSARAILPEVNIYIPLNNLENFDIEIIRTKKEITKLTEEITFSHKKLTNKNFLIKAPAEIITKEKSKIIKLNLKITKLQKYLNKVTKINHSKN